MHKVTVMNKELKQEIPDIFVPQSQTLLDALRINGSSISYGCRGGGCGMCKVQIPEGPFERGKCSKSVLSDTERNANYTLACKTYPRGDLKVYI